MGPIYQAQQSLAQATSQLDLVKAKEPERTQLREKVQFLNSLSPVHALYQQYIDKQSSLTTLERALSDAEKVWTLLLNMRLTV